MMSMNRFITTSASHWPGDDDYHDYDDNDDDDEDNNEDEDDNDEDDDDATDHHWCRGWVDGWEGRPDCCSRLSPQS